MFNPLCNPLLFIYLSKLTSMPEAKFVLKEPQTSLKEPKDAKPTLVYLFYYFNYQKLKYSTSQKILPKFWNAEKQRAKELKSFPEHTNFNFYLDKIQTIVNNEYRLLITNDIIPTPDLLRRRIDEALQKTEKIDKEDFITIFRKSFGCF